MYSFLRDNRSAIRTILGSFLTAALVFALMQPACASEPPPIPEGMYFVKAPFSLACATPDRMNEILLEEHQEIGMLAGMFDGGMVWLYYVNEGNTTASFVVMKSDEEACLIFSGSSSDGNALVPNMEPKWPTKEVGSGSEGWNISSNLPL
jgi:hypothetical protein